MIGGVLYIADYSNCKVEELHHNRIPVYFRNALERAGSKMIPGTDIFHRFPNDAVSGSVLLEESHAAIHTWPEGKFVTFELFCCGETVNANAAINYLSEKLFSDSYRTKRVARFPLE